MSLRASRVGAIGICSGLLGACVGGGTVHKIGDPAVAVLAENDPGEEASSPTPVAAMWMIEGPRASSGDAKLWAAYARVVTDFVKKSADGFAAGDEAGRAEMAKLAKGVGPVTSKYLSSDLPMIAASGYLEEHARLELEGGADSAPVRPNRVIEYIKWRAENLPDMTPETEVAVMTGRRKLARRIKPWFDVVTGLDQFVKFAMNRNDCAAVKSAADILLPAWAKLRAGAIAYSMDADARHLEFLKNNVKESDHVQLKPTVYRDTAWATASCARKSARFDEAVQPAVLATEMDPLCSLCWTERAAAHLGAGDKEAAKTAINKAQETSVNPNEQKAAREIKAMVEG